MVVTNTGAAIGSWVDRVILREAGNPTRTIELGSFTFTQPLAPGISYTRSEQLALPPTLQGLFQVVVTTNQTGSLFEHTNTGNNTTADDATILISLAPRPDLQVQSVTGPSAPVSAGGTVSLEFVVINQGTVATTPGRWTDRVFLSFDTVISADDLLIGAFDNDHSLIASDSYLTRTGSLGIPRRFGGPMFLIVHADADGRVDEFPNDGNNTGFVPIVVNPVPRLPHRITSIVNNGDGTYTLGFAGTSNVQYIVQVSLNLLDWVSVHTNTAGADGTWTYTDTVADVSASRFYRSVQP